MILKRPPPPLSAEARRQIARLKAPLEALYRACDYPARVARDPLSLVHPFLAKADQEVAGLFASALAYGRADLFRPKVTALFGIMAQRGGPAAFCRERSAAEITADIGDLGYRVTRPAHIAALCAGVGVTLRAHGSLEAAFRQGIAPEDEDIGPALARFVEGIYAAAGPGLDRGFRHLLPNPRGGSACKRLNLYLRWMVRRQAGVDLGIWAVPPRLLIIPVDTHVSRMAFNLGLTQRRDLSWRTAWEITRALKILDPEDPTRFDFALCHMGMAGDCPARRQDAICTGCGLKGLCRWWEPSSKDDTTAPQ